MLEFRDFFGTLLTALEWLILAYFILLYLCYATLHIVSFLSLRKHQREHVLDANFESKSYTPLLTPISILVPAFNEQDSIETTISSLVQLDYPEYEIIIINDGSIDATLELLTDVCALVPFPAAYRDRLKTKPVRGIYTSTKYPNLRVIDKENGGKADSLNAGINFARFPLFCSVDADSMLQRNSLRLVVQPFLEDPHTIASGGTIRIANGCRIESGFVVGTGLPKISLSNFIQSAIVTIQVIEYLRAFLFGRLGWSRFNAVLIISGAFGVFHKETVVAVDGYRSETVGEDMELIVRLHRRMRLQDLPYKIHFVAEPICWTEAPEDWQTLRNQRRRWQQGLAESLAVNRSLLFHPKSGFVGWLSYPFMGLFEGLSPIIELVGFLFMVVGFLLDKVSYEAFMVFMLVALGGGVLLSATALLLEQVTFRLYLKSGDIIRLIIAAVIENFGYRQMIMFFRLMGLYHWAVHGEGVWGTMTRRASIQRNTKEKK